MSDNERKPETAEQEADTGAAGAEPASEAGAAAGEQLAGLQEEVAQLREASLRAAAEAENARRRAQREVEQARKFALEGFARDLLPVADSLDKSVEAAADVAEDHPALLEGVELSRRLFLDTLTRAGIEVVDPAGEPFDPDFHEAMSMVDSDDAEPNSVVHVLQKGYTLNGRLLRAAMVTVARGQGN